MRRPVVNVEWVGFFASSNRLRSSWLMGLGMVSLYYAFFLRSARSLAWGRLEIRGK
jgi:hypothetical protein